MKTRNIENRLAWVGALIVLVGVSFAAGSAFAAEKAGTTSTAGTMATELPVADETIAGARKAMTDAAADAAKALQAENALDLDIQLNDLTSTIIVRAK